MNKQIYLELKNTLYKKFGIKKLAIIGSQARDDFTENSDVDLVIIDGKKDYFNRYNAIIFLSNRLNKKVDLVYFDSIRPVLKDYIKKDLIYV